jgi:hypothetical protein
MGRPETDGKLETLALPNPTTTTLPFTINGI